MDATSGTLAWMLQRWYDRVLGVAYQVVGDAGLATRAVDEAFTRLARESSGRPLDTQMLWRGVVTTLRASISRGHTISPLAPPSSDWQSALLRGLGRLEPEERLLLLLRYHEGLDYRQLSEVMGGDERTTREQCRQARSRLLAELESVDAVQ
jgi:hypothetical protein